MTDTEKEFIELYRLLPVAQQQALLVRLQQLVAVQAAKQRPQG